MKRFLIAMWFTLLLPALARAQDVGSGWGTWWLPPNRSAHGGQIDSLFTWIFWITMVTWVLVQVTMIVFLIKYRARKDKPKAHFTHGNTRLEMAWTLAPAVILAGIAIANKGVWDNFKFTKDADSPNKATLLVIGEQFKWNVIYPGPDGKLGRYLIYPKTTDTRWPDPRPVAVKKAAGAKPFIFPEGKGGVLGPAHLAHDQAVTAITQFIAQYNKLGKDFADPDGEDDDWVPDPGRAMFVPVNRPIEVQLGSKDVLHDFFLPNFRVKLDAVPGMRGRIHFTAMMTSKERETLSRQRRNVDDLLTNFAKPDNKNLFVVISKDTPGAVKDPKKDEYLYVTDPAAKKFTTIIRNDKELTAENLAKLKEAGIKEIDVYKPGYWDLVCEELCGQGHFSMQGQMFVLDQDAYKAQFETPKASAAAPTTAPSVASNQ